MAAQRAVGAVFGRTDVQEPVGRRVFPARGVGRADLGRPARRSDIGGHPSSIAGFRTFVRYSSLWAADPSQRPVPHGRMVGSWGPRWPSTSCSRRCPAVPERHAGCCETPCPEKRRRRPSTPQPSRSARSSPMRSSTPGRRCGSASSWRPPRSAWSLPTAASTCHSPATTPAPPGPDGGCTWSPRSSTSGAPTTTRTARWCGSRSPTRRQRSHRAPPARSRPRADRRASPRCASSWSTCRC